MGEKRRELWQTVEEYEGIFAFLRARTHVYHSAKTFFSSDLGFFSEKYLSPQKIKFKYYMKNYRVEIV